MMSHPQLPDASRRPVRCAVITVSAVHSKSDDPSGRIILEGLERSGFNSCIYEVIPDDPEQMVQLIRGSAKMQPCIDAILINGGTGIAGRDSSFEAIESLLEKRMPGFGELFRYLSFTEDTGAAAMTYRATSGVYRKMAVFAFPGSEKAVTLVMNRLILPELVNILKEIKS